MVQVALAWFLAKPQVATPMIGVHKYEHLCSDVDALSLSLTSEDMAFLEETYVSHELVSPFSLESPESSSEHEGPSCMTFALADAALAASSIATVAQLAPNDWGNSGFPGESRAE